MPKVRTAALRLLRRPSAGGKLRRANIDASAGAVEEIAASSGASARLAVNEGGAARRQRFAPRIHA